MSVCGISINGRLTGYGVTSMSSYEVAKPYRSEINANNSWNVNFNDGNVNNNNKFNDNYVRPCTANVEYLIILQTVWDAYEDCLKGKMSSPQALEYMPSAAEDIMYVYAYRKYTINRTIGRFIDKVNLCLSECENGMTEIRAEYWSQMFNSYFGFLVQGNEYRKRTEIFKMLPHSWYVYFNITNRRKVTIKRKFRYDKCNQEPYLRQAAA